MSETSKSPNYPFLIFLVLLTQGNVALKVVGLAFIFFASNRTPNRLDARSMGIFYLLMFVYSLFSIYTYFESYDISYLALYVLGISFWILGFISFQFIYQFVTDSSSERIDATLTAYFTVNLAFCVFQVIKLFILFDWTNPFANQSSGDDVMGIFANSSVNLIVSSFYIFYFYYKKKNIRAMLAALVCIGTAYMSGLVILLAVTGYFLMTSSRLKLGHRLSILAAGVVLLAVLWMTARSNVIYAKDILTTIIKQDKPRKVVSFIQTYDYLMDSPSNLIFGAGMGNFSSRLAFMANGEYVKWYPRTLLYRNIDFTKNHYGLWNANVLYDRNNRGTSNQPFSVYNQIFGEYGLLGFFILMLFYFAYPFRNYRKMTYGRILFTLMISYFVLDYWFEFFSITIILEMMFLYDVKTARLTAASNDISKT